MRSKLILTLSIITLVALTASPIVMVQAGFPWWFPEPPPNWFPPPPRVIDPIVSTDWLASYVGPPDLVILDIRGTTAYLAGYIPGAINVNESEWYINDPFGPDLPWMEVPDQTTLFTILGDAGITKDSLVVVVGSTSGPLYPIPFALYSIAGISRVAFTLVYAGIRNVAILDGGIEKWIDEGKALNVSGNPTTLPPVTYTAQLKSEMLVSKDYVAERIEKSILVDARDPDVYFGVTIEPWPPTPTAGHIPTARSLPTPWLWNLNLDPSATFVNYATYKDTDTLREIAAGVIEHGFGWRLIYTEIIAYCGVGGYGSTMHYVLSEVLGYQHVRLYDGSWEEWSSDPAAPVVLYEWE